MKVGLRVLAFLVLIAPALSLANPRRIAAGDEGYVLPVAADEFKIVSYNVENLFDISDDAGKLDATFMPKASAAKKIECPKLQGNYKQECFNTDWVQPKVEIKLRQIQRALEAQGPLPDILALVEIENEAIVAQLAKVLGYREFRVSNGPDERGIDLAVLWRTEKLQFVSMKELPVPGMELNPTRPLFKTHFRVREADARRAGADLVLFVNHWPSQANPTKARISAAMVMRREIELDSRSAGDGYHVVAVGDFNTRPDERPNAIDDGILDPKWKFSLLDTHKLSDNSKNPMNGIMPVGTYFFPSAGWGRFDKILVSRNFTDGKGMEILPETFRVVGPAFMRHASGREQIPTRYDFSATTPARAGFSDHLPIAVKFKLP